MKKLIVLCLAIELLFVVMLCAGCSSEKNTATSDDSTVTTTSNAVTSTVRRYEGVSSSGSKGVRLTVQDSKYTLEFIDSANGDKNTVEIQYSENSGERVFRYTIKNNGETTQNREMRLNGSEVSNIGLIELDYVRQGNEYVLRANGEELHCQIVDGGLLAKGDEGAGNDRFLERLKNNYYERRTANSVTFVEIMDDGKAVFGNGYMSEEDDCSLVYQAGKKLQWTVENEVVFSFVHDAETAYVQFMGEDYNLKAK